MTTTASPSAQAFDSWVAHTTSDVYGNLKYEPVPAKPWDEDDIDIKVTYCGVCGSDYSALEGKFFPLLPQQVCGHEIVGVVTRAGTAVTGIKVGDTVGVGAQCDSCGNCEYCDAHEEQFCTTHTNTIGAPWTRGNAAGTSSHGGFAKTWRGPARFAVPIPAGYDPALAAPMMCGGITVYSPLKHYRVGPGTRVGIVGIGGLGHLAVQIAKAMGARVTVFSRGEGKRTEAAALGGDEYVGTTGDAAVDFGGRARSLDLILSTINPQTLPIGDYLTMLRPRGTFVTVGIVVEPLAIPTVKLITGVTSVAGSWIGSPSEMAELMEFAARHDIKPWIKKYNMDDINQAFLDYKTDPPRYRFVLVNTDNGGFM